MRRVFALSLLSFALAHAAAFDVNLEYEKLALRNGRVIENARIKSYDHGNGKVTVISGKNIHSIQLELLPDNVAARILELVPTEATAVAREEKTDRKQAARAEQQARQERDKARVEQKAQDSRQQREAVAESNAENSEVRLFAATTRLARERASRYFRYEYKPGSGSTFVIRQDVTLENPELIPGWPGRCRVQGSIGLEFYDSRGHSFGTSLRSFEVTVEQDSTGATKVVDFTAK